MMFQGRTRTQAQAPSEQPKAVFQAQFPFADACTLVLLHHALARGSATLVRLQRPFAPV